MASKNSILLLMLLYLIKNLSNNGHILDYKPVWRKSLMMKQSNFLVLLIVRNLIFITCPRMMKLWVEKSNTVLITQEEKEVIAGSILSVIINLMVDKCNTNRICTQFLKNLIISQKTKNHHNKTQYFQIWMILKRVNFPVNPCLI